MLSRVKHDLFYNIGAMIHCHDKSADLLSHWQQKRKILHARIRTNCSSLHYTLFSKNIIQDKFCTCGEIEDVQHFLFSRARFTAQRQIMLEKVQRHCVPTLNVLLYGERSLTSNTNCTIFKAVFRSLSPIQNDLRINYQYNGTFSYPIRSTP